MSSKFSDNRYLPIRRALRKLFPDGIPDWVIALFNKMPDLTDHGIATIAAKILALATEHSASLKNMQACLKRAMTFDGSVSMGSGATLAPKKKKM